MSATDKTTRLRFVHDEVGRMLSKIDRLRSDLAGVLRDIEELMKDENQSVDLYTIHLPGMAFRAACDPNSSPVPEQEGWPTPAQKSIGLGSAYTYYAIPLSMAENIRHHLTEVGECLIFGIDVTRRSNGRACLNAAEDIERQIENQKKALARKLDRC